MGRKKNKSRSAPGRHRTRTRGKAPEGAGPIDSLWTTWRGTPHSGTNKIAYLYSTSAQSLTAKGSPSRRSKLIKLIFQLEQRSLDC